MSLVIVVCMIGMHVYMNVHDYLNRSLKIFTDSNVGFIIVFFVCLAENRGTVGTATTKI